MGCDSLGIDSN